MASVLEGVRVLDLSSGVAGPITGMLLADHGADVIKVEPPGGDPFRGNPGYDVWLRGRRSVELDLHVAGRPGALRSLSSIRPTSSWRASRRAPRRASASTPRRCSRATRRWSTARSPRTGRMTGHRDRPGYDALVAARLGILHEQRGHLGGALPRMHGEAPYLEDLEIPDGMAPGSPRTGPIFTYTPWLSMCGRRSWPRPASARALYARHAHRARPARRNLLAAGGFFVDGVQVAARGASRCDGPALLGLRPARRPRACSSAPTGGGCSSGCPTRRSCSPAPTARRSSSAARSTGCATTRRASRRTRRTSPCSRTTTR